MSAEGIHAGNYRDARREAEKFILGNPSNNCCTIGEDLKVKCWQATEFPVKLKEVDESNIFLYSDILRVDLK